MQTPGGKQILIGGSNSPSGLLSALGQLMPFWDRDIDLVVVPQANGDQLNGLLAVLDRYAVQHIMAAEIPTDSRAGREWWMLITQKNHQPLELQTAGLDTNVSLTFDGITPLIESGAQCLALGASERAQINVIAGQTDRLPEQPQLILTWTSSLSDTRVIDLTQRGTLDLLVTGDGVTINELR